MSRRNVRFQMVHERASRNMRVVQGRSKKETYLSGIGQGVIFLFIGCLILGLNIQKVGNPSIIIDLQALPTWVWMLGGGLSSFGICWIIRNIWLFVTLVRARE